MYHLICMNMKLTFRKSRVLFTTIFSLVLVLLPIVLMTYVVKEQRIDNFTTLVDRYFAEVAILLFIVYMTAQMATDDYRTGYLKNIVNSFENRASIFLSKLVVNSFIFVPFVMIVQVILMYLGCLVLVPEFVLGDVGLLVRIVFLQTVLAITASAVVMMLGTLFRKPTPTYIVATFMCTGTYETILNLVNLIQQWLLKRVVFDFTQLGIAEHVSKLSEENISTTFILCLCAVYLALSCGIGVLRIRKQDL